MQTLVVPTDFSPAADNAMLFAGNLATSMNANICLLHIYQIPVSMNDVPVMIIPVEELQEIADKGLEKAKELLMYDEMSLGEIADQLGYSSVQHLSQQFKKITGLTPSHFKQLKENKRKPLDKV